MPASRKQKARFRSVADYTRWVASQGGKARKKALTAEQRRAIARKAIRARWRKKKA